MNTADWCCGKEQSGHYNLWPSWWYSWTIAGYYNWFSPALLLVCGSGTVELFPVIVTGFRLLYFWFQLQLNITNWNLSKTELGYNGNLSLAEDFYSPWDPDFRYLYYRGLSCNGKHFVLLQFRYRQVYVCSVFFFFFCWMNKRRSGIAIIKSCVSSYF